MTLDLDRLYNASGQARDRISSLRWEGPNLSPIRIDLSWDSLDRLVSRAVTYAGNPVITVSFQRDDQGRLTQVTVAGPWMRIPLTYDLTYPASGTEPVALAVSATVSNKLIPVLTLGFTWAAQGASLAAQGLGALDFSDALAALEVAVGQTAKNPTGIPVLKLDFSATADSTNRKIVKVWDIWKKPNPQDQVQVGQLDWTLDSGTKRTTAFDWKTETAPGSGVWQSQWHYERSWSAYADLPAAMDAQLQTAEKDALRACYGVTDSFDVERLLRFIVDRYGSLLLTDAAAPLRDRGANLFDQVRAALK
jgi:hypothetical protein